MISLVLCVVRTTFTGFVCFLVAICSFDHALCNHFDADDPPPVFPPKSLESPYPKLLHERDIIRYQDAEGQFVSIGSGAFADVTLGELADSGSHVVIKSFRNSPFREILKEIRMHRYAEHLGVTSRLIGLLPSGPLAGNISLVFEYIPYSNTITDWLTEDKLLTTTQWIWICRQIALALLRLHQHEVLFNDLHRGNVLIQKQGLKLQVYLIDFGFASFKFGSTYGPSQGNFSGYNFIAPELAQGIATSEATDVFALGYVFDKVAAKINVIPLLFLAHWCMASDPTDRPQLLTVIAKLDSILFGVQLVSWRELSKHDVEYNDFTSKESIDYFILTKEQVADVSSTYLYCPTKVQSPIKNKEETSEWIWLLHHKRIISQKCPVPLFVLDEHDLLREHINDTIWLSRASSDAIRLAQLKLTNQTVILKDFYGVPFEKIRSEACMTAFFGEIDISPRIIGILIEYKKMIDIAFVQEVFGNGVPLSKFVFVTSGNEWDLEFLRRAAEDRDFQRACPMNSLQFFLGLINDEAARTCQAKSHRRLILEKISTMLVQKMIFVHDSGYLINNFRTNNVLIKLNFSNSGTFEVNIRLIDLRLTSSVHPGIYLDTSAKDVPRFTYFAPEVLRGEITSRSSDIYSLCFALYQIMTDYFVTSASSLTKKFQTVNNYFNVYGNSTIQETNHSFMSKVKSSHSSESELMENDTAVLRYHNLLLKCLHSEPRDRPDIRELLSVSSLAFS